jgi:hypothetical protein
MSGRAAFSASMVMPAAWRSAIAAFALLLPSAAAAQNEQWTAQIRELLGKSGEFYTERGYVATDINETGSLRDDESESVRIALESGVEYAVFAVCDVDCSDIDLVLYDPGDNEVDKDVEADDVPIMMLTPASTGRYRLKVTMAACKEPPCFYGMAVYRKDK